MSLQLWQEDDMVLLIEWAANESIFSIKAGQWRDAEIIQKGLLAIIGIGQEVWANDHRVNKWLCYRLSQVFYPLRDAKRFAEIEVDRGSIICSMIMLTKYFEMRGDGSDSIGQEVVLPEPFDESKVFW